MADILLHDDVTPEEVAHKASDPTESPGLPSTSPHIS
jgi:hypothetical protein